MKENSFYYQVGTDGLIVQFQNTRQILSSAVYHGGLCSAKNIVNHKVMDNSKGEHRQFPTIEETYQELEQKYHLEGNTVGLMTSAKLSSFYFVEREFSHSKMAIFLSVGLSNAMTAGDDVGIGYRVGTINTIFVTDQKLTDAAMVEAVAILTEAKVESLRQYKIGSYVSGLPATGTGTDSIAIVNGNVEEVSYCGKHTEMGRDMARLFMEAFSQSVKHGNCLLLAPGLESREENLWENTK